MGDLRSLRPISKKKKIPGNTLVTGHTHHTLVSPQAFVREGESDFKSKPFGTLSESPITLIKPAQPT